MNETTSGESISFQFLGTSAGEQYPAHWCSCDHCKTARRLGGRNVRSNACAYIAPGVMIDFGPEACAQARRYGVALSDIGALFVTHSHPDHLYPPHLFWRKMPVDQELPPPMSARGPRFSEARTLRVFGSLDAVAALDAHAHAWNLTAPTADEERLYDMETEVVRHGMAGSACGLDFHVFEANHLDRTVNGNNYAFCKGGKTILYAVDTGWPLEKTWAEFEKFQYDLVVADATFGFGEGSDRHLNLKKLTSLRAEFARRSLLATNATFAASHVGPHFSPVHDAYVKILEDEDILLAYDGLRLELA